MAGPPFATDDPEPVDLHHYEFYVATQYAHDVSGVTFTQPHLELNYGAAPELQLHLVTPLVHTRPAGGGAETGYGDTEVGAKYRFLRENSHRPQIGIFPLIEVPTGNANKGLGNGKAQFYLPVWLQKSWGQWTSYGGGGYRVNPGAGNRNWWSTGWELQCDLSKHLTLGGELYHTTPSVQGDAAHTGFNLGAIINLNDDHHVLLSVGRHLKGDNRLSFYAAHQWTWGPADAGTKAGPRAAASAG